MRIRVLFLVALPAMAQQTIFDVPSADVSGRGQWFYQHQSVARNWQPGRRWIQTHAVGYGVGHNVELDATWFNIETKRLGDSLPSAGFKWSPRLNSEDSKVLLRFVAGEMVQFRRNGDQRVGHWTYLMLNAELPSSRTHVTGGFNAGSGLLFGERTTGVLLGVEQHINDRWMLQADWFSDKHDLAYLIPDVVYKATDHWMVSLGYQIPNRASPGFGAVVFELTRFP